MDEIMSHPSCAIQSGPTYSMLGSNLPKVSPVSLSPGLDSGIEDQSLSSLHNEISKLREDNSAFKSQFTRLEGSIKTVLDTNLYLARVLNDIEAKNSHNIHQLSSKIESLENEVGSLRQELSFIQQSSGSSKCNLQPPPLSKSPKGHLNVTSTSQANHLSSVSKHLDNSETEPLTVGHVSDCSTTADVEISGSRVKDACVSSNQISKKSDVLPNLSGREKFVSKRFYQKTKSIRSSLTPTNIEKLDRNEISQLFLEMKDIQKTTEDLHSSLLSYLDSGKVHIEPHIESEVNETILLSHKWCSSVRKKYYELELNIKPLNPDMFSDLEQFSHMSQSSIYDFLNRFEIQCGYSGTDSERGQLLYSSYLSEEICDEIKPLRESFTSCKEFLINEFGNPTFLVNQIISRLNDLKKPSEKCSLDNFRYFSKLRATIHELLRLKQIVPDYMVSEYESYIYSYDFIVKLLSHLPEGIQDDFFKGVPNLWRIKGPGTFAKLESLIEAQFYIFKNRKLLSDLGNPLKPKFRYTGPKKSSNQSSCQYKNTRHQHYYNMVECSTFLRISPEIRRKKTFRKSCFSCLGPVKECQSKCLYESAVSVAGLHCNKVRSGTRPKNILLCSCCNISEKTKIYRFKKYAYSCLSGK